MRGSALPLPPGKLMARAGLPEGADPRRFYLDEGERLRQVIEDLLPDDWAWPGKRALDFGCGAARVLRQFAPEAAGGAFHGSDIDLESIRWARSRLSPPFHFFANGPAPPLDLPAASLDLIWAMSVFTHVTDLWSEWLVELHRVLAPGGLLLVSFLGEGVWEPMVGEPYVEDAVGMCVRRHWEGPDAEVFHSEWWLREHWGRLFEILRVRRPPVDPSGRPQITHSYLSLRRREVSVSAGDLTRIDPGEWREVAALETALRLARREQAQLDARAGDLRAALAGVPALRRLRAISRRRLRPFVG